MKFFKLFFISLLHRKQKPIFSLWQIACICLILFSQDKSAYADVSIDINQGTQQAMRVAILPFQVDSVSQDVLLLPNKMYKVIEQNLTSSGLFSIIPENAYISNNAQNPLDMPKFADWRVVNASVVLLGKINKTPAGKVKIKIDAGTQSGKI